MEKTIADLKERPFFQRVDAYWTFGEGLHWEDVESIGDYIEEEKAARLVEIAWLTVCNCRLRVEGLVSKCKVQLTAKARLHASRCLFCAQELTRTEAAVEVFANSRAVFEGCVFADSPRVAVVCRDFSHAVFKDCVFHGNAIGVFTAASSVCVFEGCAFRRGLNIDIFLSGDSQARLDDCTFRGGRKAVLAKEACTVVCSNCSFRDMEKGAITASGGEVDMVGVECANMRNTAIRLKGGCVARCECVACEGIDGNCVNIENSQGVFRGCLFKDSMCPLVAAVGKRANPVFVDCDLAGCPTYLAVSKLFAVPIFDGCVFADGGSHGLCVGNYSHPTVRGCVFSHVAKDDVILHTRAKLHVDDVPPTRPVGASLVDKADHCSLRAPLARGPHTIGEDSVRIKGDCEVREVRVEECQEEEEEEGERVETWRSPSYILPPTVGRLQVSLSPCRPRLACGRIVGGEVDPVVGPIMNIPCGHCADEEGGRCHLCDSPVRRRVEVRDEGECAVCLDKRATVVCVPCGHLAMCASCALQCVDMSFNCPACNEPISSISFL